MMTSLVHQYLWHHQPGLGQSYFAVVQSLSLVRLLATPRTAAQTSLSFYLLELAQTHVRSVSDAIQPFLHLSFPSPPAFIFPSIRVFPSESGQNVGVSASASVLPVNIQGWSPLGLTGLISLQSKGLSRVLCNSTVWKHQFVSAQLSL